MSEIISKRLKNSIGKHAKIFLSNGFRYEGTITNSDEKYVEILEPERGYKIILIKDISDVDVSIGNSMEEGE